MLGRIAPVRGAKDVVERWVGNGHQVVVATGRPSDTSAASLQWLAQHGFIGTDFLLVDEFFPVRGTPRNTIPEYRLKP